MDGGHYCLAFLGEPCQQLNDLEGSSRVESCCGLVQENDVGVGDQLDADGCSFPFAPRDTFNESVADLHVAAVLQA